MTKLSTLISAYANAPRLKAKLLTDIALNNGTVMQKGSTSDILIDLGNGVYHFESDDSACQVNANEIEFVNSRRI